jgi:hypothetical protein
MLVAGLLVIDGRAASAVGLLEVAAELWGTDTGKGRESLARAQALRAELEQRGDAAPAAAPLQDSPAR